MTGYFHCQNCGRVYGQADKVREVPFCGRCGSLRQPEWVHRAHEHQLPAKVASR